MKRLVKLSNSEVLYLPGGCSALPGQPFHILRATQNGPYRRFCDDTDDFESRRVELVAPVADWCATCLRRYAVWGGNLHRLGENPREGFYIVAGGVGYLAATIAPYEMTYRKGIKMLARFRYHLSKEAARYGYIVDWQPDYLPLPVLLADSPAYRFDWNRLRLVVMELAAADL